MPGLSCFKAYDVRGKLGEELNDDIAYRIGRAYAQFFLPSSVVVGGDVRLTSETLKLALSNGLRDGGADVIDIGMCGTEEIYFATSHLGVDGGIVVTASHNPIDYNGMKLVREGSKPISGDTGLKDIQRLAEENEFPAINESLKGQYSQVCTRAAYTEHLLTYIDISKLKPLKLVVNAGNGAAGPALDALEKYLPFEIIKVNHQPDGTFPSGIPNPILVENRAATRDAVIAHGADMGIAWDGDFDRCFLFDEKGDFVEGYYIVGLLAEAFLKKSPNSKVVHDPRLIWNTQSICEENGGQAIQCKTGHAFIKERMRAENAIYGGEMSAHHYFRDFFYCDSGMIPWLLVVELVSFTGSPLSQLVGDRMKTYPCSGEINYQVQDAQASIASVRNHYESSDVAGQIDTTDGLSMEFPGWRLNIRASNTEPLLRLNVESRGDSQLVEQRVAEIQALIKTGS